jgi:SAM-dependent methyltransferase
MHASGERSDHHSSADRDQPSPAPLDAPTAMDNATGKRVLALIRDGDYAHPGEETANELLFAGVRPDPRRRLLDAGCGGAGTAAWVQLRGLGSVTGIESHPATARLARERHPDVTVVDGDIQRAGEVLEGPFDLMYSMTAIYAARDIASVFRELRTLAAPGAELRLFEYADPRGLFAAATGGSPTRGWWHPLAPRAVPELLASAGWACVSVRDLHPEFVHWYRDLCMRIADRRTEICGEFGRDWYQFVLREYADILDLVSAGALGGVLVRGRAAP